MSRRPLADRLASIRGELDSILSEARLDFERKKLDAERAQHVLIDAEMAARRAVAGARAARRPRHLLPREGEEP